MVRSKSRSMRCIVVAPVSAALLYRLSGLISFLIISSMPGWVRAGVGASRLQQILDSRMLRAGRLETIKVVETLFHFVFEHKPPNCNCRNIVSEVDVDI